MKRIFLLVLALNCGLLAALPGAEAVPLFFIPNQGQVASPVRFMVKSAGLTAYFLPGKIELKIGGVDVIMRFEDSSAKQRIEGGQPLPGRVNFLAGSEANWRINLEPYGSVIYRDLYPGIDMKYGGTGRNLKSEFLVAPGADPSAIRVRYANAGMPRIDRDGSLVLPVEGAAIRELAPVVYQDGPGVREEVAARFQIHSDGTVGFQLAAYDVTRPLVIDPVLSYSTLLGGSGLENAMAIAVDANGSAYVAGFTDSLNFPATNPVQSFSGGGTDVFVAKLNPAGNGLIYCTYLGGNADDRASAIAVDALGSAYITGSTTSRNFPVRAAMQPALAGYRNAFVAKLSPAGNSLVYSTYLGGNSSDTAYGIALDSSGAAYVVGDTTSFSFPATGFQRGTHGGQDAFVAKLSVDGTHLVYSTYLGGSGEDHGAAIAVDAGGSAYVTGATSSADFPVLNAAQRNNAGGQDAFVTRFSADGNFLLFSTYLGGSGGTVMYPEIGQAIAVDLNGNAYVTGQTSSPDFPLASALQSSRRGEIDAFVTKLNSSGVTVYSTYLGGSGVDVASAVAVDAAGAAYVAGYTLSTDLPVANAQQSTNAGEYDAFLARLSPAGDALQYLTYLGGSGSDAATAVALDPAANLYVAGYTLSTNFPVHNSYQTINAGNYGAFVTKVDLSGLRITAALAVAVTHSGSFVQTQNGATYSITVSNGAGGASSSGIVTVTDSIPAGLTLVSIVGTGWACAGNVCARSDALPAGASYPAITATVNVSATASSPLSNSVSVTGGGSFGASASDTTVITALVTARATFVKLDGTTQGTWKESYGTDGVVINADVTNYPAYAQVSMSGQGPVVWIASTSDLRGLQKFAASDRIASGWYSFSNMSLDLNLTDGNTHLVALYCLDWDAGGRAERFDVLDAVSNTVLDTRSITAFQSGQYLLWNLKGHVKLKVTVTGGSNAVVNGLFFSAPVTISPLLSIAATHSGNFTQGQNGATYSIAVNNGGGTAPTSGIVTVTESLPAGLTMMSMAGTGWTCAASSCARSDALAVGASYPAITAIVNVSASAPSPLTNQVNVSGGGSPGASANDPTVVIVVVAASASFVRVDTATLGTWKGVYGADGGVVNGDAANYPSYAQVSMSGQGPFVWGASTSDVRGLQKFAAADRIASGWYSFTNMSFDLNLTDGNTHQVALYFLDWDGGARAERIDVLDSATNAILDTRSISGFPGGQYLVWNLKGHVKLKVTATGGSNAVVNGLFFSAPGTASPALSIAATHSASFTQGQTGATYSITVSNGVGAGPSSGIVAVTESIPAGLTLVSMVGAGWSCVPNACTRSDALAAGASYPAITATVNVSAGAPSSLTNQVSVSGGGSPVASANDPTVISVLVPAAVFVKLDTTSQGTWKGVYGADGVVINADVSNSPAYAQVTMGGQGPFVWVTSTSDVRGLQKFAASDRIASGWYSFTNMSFDLNLTDGNNHQVALYCLDWDGGARAERFDVVDSATNAILDTRSISGFQGGQYLVWNLKGHVKLKVTVTGGSNAVVDGLFFR